MNDRPNAPIPAPEADRQLDHALTGLPRYAPVPGFVERVLGRVRVPLPAWARTVRDWLRSYVTGVRGWVILGSLSVATAASWAVAIGLTVSYWDELTYGLDVIGLAAVPGWQEVAALAGTWVNAAAAGLVGWTGALGIPFGILAGTYAAVTLVSVVALWRLTAEPAGMRLAR